MFRPVVALLFFLLSLLPAATATAADAPPAAPAAAGALDPAAVTFFETKIRPVLVENCYECHSAQAAKLKGNLRLDTRAGVLQGGESGPALVAGKPDESRLIKAIRHTETDLKMPPKRQLPAEVIADLEKWVAMGAPDPREGPAAAPAAAGEHKGVDIDAGRKFWAFQPLAKPEPPAVQEAAGTWVRTAVDRFIAAKQEQQGVVPNPVVGREKLIRRAYYDLTGLPPTPAEVDAFVSDPAPDAYEKLIDRLLASERYGERWGRHWLDVVRYAESGGYEFDGDRAGAYHYRDFVIRAFNQDMPFDQFVKWQLAGDKLLPGDYHAGSATGFLVAGPYPGQITAKTAEPIRYDQLDDMIATVGTGMLGMTLQCARCHDHKYDPIPQQDYYRLIACLAQTDSVELKLDPQPEIHAKAKAEWDAAHAPLVAAWDKFVKEQFPARFEQSKQQKMTEAAAATWLTLNPVTATSSSGKSPVLKKLDDDSVLAPATPDPSEVYTFVGHTNLKQIIGLRIEALADPSLPKQGPGRGADGDFLLTRVELKATPLNGQGQPVDVKLKPAAATAEAPNRALAGTLDADPNTGWAVGAAAGAAGKDQAASYETEGPVAGFDGGTVLTLTLRFENAPAVGRLRAAITTGPRPAAVAPQGGREIAALLAAGGGAVTDANREQIVRWFRTIDPEARAAYAPIEQHLAQEPKPNLAGVFASGDRGGPVHFLVRGETGRKKDQAVPGFMQVLMTAPEKDAKWGGGNPATTPPAPPTAEPRVALANWITDAEHGAGHLLARVMANRLWQHHMGRGIVATPNDFGTQGEPPTHPELLDYLASEFVKGGWRLKPLHKLLMTSAVYMQGGAEVPANTALDVDNKLWWRRPSQRLEAESVRDAMLAVSGTLQLDMYGPATADENGPRRSVYLRVKRSQPVALMQLFDAPEAIQSIGQRQVTTVATQALTMMNSPFVRQRAEQLAKRARPSASVELPAAVEEAYRVAVSRRPTEAERARMLAFIAAQAASYGGDPAAAAERGLVDFCQVLLCSNEFVYVD